MAAAAPGRSAAYLGLLALLLALRIPAVVEPPGNDQSLYTYVGDTIRRGGVPYVDAWDQKPPGIHVVYAAIGAIAPRQAAAAVADLMGAGLTAWALVLLGRRAIGGRAGELAAAVFLLFGHPSVARMSGVYIRGQCETFIALAITAALCLLWRPKRSTGALVGAGLLCGVAFWLKYNAIAYALPIAVALAMGPGGAPGARRWTSAAGWLAAGAGAISFVVLAFFAARGALGALWLATIDYNLAYSGETYTATGAVSYLAGMPFSRARADMLWYLGAIGVALIVLRWRAAGRAAPLLLAWLAAVVLSIAINGARDLPQYFVQAGPALALTFAAGLGTGWTAGAVWRLAIVAALVAGLWRVGNDPATVLGMRWGGLPQLADNVAYDLRYMAGALDRRTYLARFTGGPKYDAQEVAALAGHVAATTAPADTILVFGFSPAVYVAADRQSASRFFWSRPVILEFAADRPGYGSLGLLQDLERSRPQVVALQKRDWSPDVSDSIDFFLGTPHLANWLRARYTLERDTAYFSVWRRATP